MKKCFFFVSAAAHSAALHGKMSTSWPMSPKRGRQQGRKKNKKTDERSDDIAANRGGKMLNG